MRVTYLIRFKLSIFYLWSDLPNNLKWLKLFSTLFDTCVRLAN